MRKFFMECENKKIQSSNVTVGQFDFPGKFFLKMDTKPFFTDQIPSASDRITINHSRKPDNGIFDVDILFST